MISKQNVLNAISVSSTGKFTTAEVAKMIGVNERSLQRGVKEHGLEFEFKESKRAGRSRDLVNSVVRFISNGGDVADYPKIRKNKNVRFALETALEEGLIDRGVCTFCGESHDYKFGSGVFCSMVCSRRYASGLVTPEGRELQRLSLKSGREKNEKMYRDAASLADNQGRPLLPEENPWEWRSKLSEDEILARSLEQSRRMKEYWTDERRREFGAKRRDDFASGRSVVSDDTRELMSKAAKKRVEDGTHKGWQSRPKGLRSYPEKYWDEVLESRGVDFVRELPVNKRDIGMDDSRNYFLDIAIYTEFGIIDLEIDGGQHNRPEDIKHDKIRDENLVNSGFIVYRIKWVNPTVYKEEVEHQIDELLDFLKNHGVRVAKRSVL